jgi:predicted proteasome-type protease
MQDKPSGAGDERATTTAEEDHRDQESVLRHVLSIYPEVLTHSELVREMTGGDSPQFAERDRIERAVSDLIAGGLLHEDAMLVLPTRPAVLCHSLLDA